ncbi:hypothetical protein [Pandoraea pulmonicola]|uniref:Uncharacterized protein n=1 Tax=Pandoraea pulmonicola TaxID=93221 RepID=A0AAJ4ZD47_PANPU|nr:hypothetical protein [Pandoraea pulmonicola]AJC20389.1 hypothetical protein RO07_07730 [Pandoraea pulmonicola]SUA91228.1 Uncharacterised protein [Pandoraea pulmonicola]
MAYINPFYRGFRLETCVFREQDAGSTERKHDRTFGVSVRISRISENAPASSLEPRLFRLDSLPFDSIGDARRAGEAFGRSWVDDLMRSTEVQA